MTAVLEQPLNLSLARCGARLKILSVREDSPACHRLRELGFCESAEVCKIADGSALICRLCGVRVAIGRELGKHIFVEAV